MLRSTGGRSRGPGVFRRGGWPALPRLDDGARRAAVLVQLRLAHRPEPQLRLQLLPRIRGVHVRRPRHLDPDFLADIDPKTGYMAD